MNIRSSLVFLIRLFLQRGHNDNPEELREVLREMTNYTLTHFETEEAYMKELNYPEYQDHKEEHRGFFHWNNCLPRESD